MKKPKNTDGIVAINDAIRCQLIEYIVRIVKVKYVDTGIHDNYTQGLEFFFKTVLPRYARFLKPW